MLQLKGGVDKWMPAVTMAQMLKGELKIWRSLALWSGCLPYIYNLNNVMEAHAMLFNVGKLIVNNCMTVSINKMLDD